MCEEDLRKTQSRGATFGREVVYQEGSEYGEIITSLVRLAFLAFFSFYHKDLWMGPRCGRDRCSPLPAITLSATFIGC